MIAIAIAGGFSILALLFSMLLVFLSHRKREKTDVNLTGYECGFEADLREDFVYLTEKIHFVSIYLVFELVIFWILLCCSFDIMTKDWSGKLFIRIFLLAIAIIMLICYKFLFDRNAQK